MFRLNFWKPSIVAWWIWRHVQGPHVGKPIKTAWILCFEKSSSICHLTLDARCFSWGCVCVGGGEVRGWVISFLVWAKIFLQAYNFDRIFWCWYGVMNCLSSFVPGLQDISFRNHWLNSRPLNIVVLQVQRNQVNLDPKGTKKPCVWKTSVILRFFSACFNTTCSNTLIFSLLFPRSPLPLT